MRFKHHFLLGAIFAILLYFFFSPIISLFGILVIFLSSVLIDVDHYLYYLYQKGDFSLIKAYKWYMSNIWKFHSLTKEQQKKVYIGFYIFHGVEVLIILFLLGVYVSQFFSLIFIGFFFHLSSDLVSEIIAKQRIDKISLIHNYFMIRKLTPL